MPKACRVKILTKRPRKRRGFYGNKGKKNTNVNNDVNIGVDCVNGGVNSDVSGAVNIENFVNNNDCGGGGGDDPHNISVLSADTWKI